LGLVVGISFIEAPLKFRAPGITTALALGIGRLVFHTMNMLELFIAGFLVVLTLDTGHGWPLALSLALAAIIVGHACPLRRALAPPQVRVLEGERVELPRLHFAYIALEGLKVVLLIALGLVLGSRWVS